jgi:hypothetical protein
VDVVAAPRGADVRLRIPAQRLSERRSPEPPPRRRTSGDPHRLPSSQAT